MIFARLNGLSAVDELVEVVAADAPQHFRKAPLDLVAACRRQIPDRPIARRLERRRRRRRASSCSRVERPEVRHRSVGRARRRSSQHVIDRLAVHHRPRAAGVVRDHPADGRAARGGDVGREAQAVRLQRARSARRARCPGSTQAQRSATFSSRMRLRYFDVSSWRPAPIAWPACDVPPPRAVIETCWRARSARRGRHPREFAERRRRAARSDRRWRRSSTARARWCRTGLRRRCSVRVRGAARRGASSYPQFRGSPMRRPAPAAKRPEQARCGCVTSSPRDPVARVHTSVSRRRGCAAPPDVGSMATPGFNRVELVARSAPILKSAIWILPTTSAAGSRRRGGRGAEPLHDVLAGGSSGSSAWNLILT